MNKQTKVNTVEIRDEMYKWYKRASEIKYKNEMPKLPKTPTTSTMMGFRKRFDNWKQALKNLENDNSTENQLIQNNTVIADAFEEAVETKNEN